MVRWALSKIITTPRGAITTEAADRKLAPTVENLFPPDVERVGGAVSPFALVRLVGGLRGLPDKDTFLLPDIDDTDQIGSVERVGEIDAIVAKLPTAYQYTDYTGKLVTVQRSLITSPTTSRTFGDVLNDFRFGFLQHSLNRTRTSIEPRHETEYTDDFTSDPLTGGLWTEDTGTWNYDAVNDDVDQTAGTSLFALRYSANSPGFEMESQGYCRGNSDWYGAAMCRASSGAMGYNVEFEVADTVYFMRGGTTLTTWADIPTFAHAQWLGARVAAEGANGANVSLSFWFDITASETKPTGPFAWFGDDGTPDRTTTDSSASRLDDSSVDLYAGLGSYGSATLDLWGCRAISDRNILAPRGIQTGCRIGSRYGIQTGGRL